MKIELKNVKFSEFASEETNCFQAAVYIDGKKAGVVSNDGHGGPDYYAPHSLGETLNDYAKTLPKYEFYGRLHDHNAETFIGDLFDNHQSEKKLKALLKTKYVFTVSGQHGIYSQKYYVVKGMSLDEVIRSHVAAKKEAVLTANLKAEKLLNFMPFDEALALFKVNVKPLAHLSKPQPSEADPQYSF